MGPREIGPVSAITLMAQNLGGPLVLVVIQAVQISRTLYLGGTTGPVAGMTPAQLHDALDAGYTYSLLWIAAVAVLVGVSSFWIGFSAKQIAAAQHTREAVEAGELTDYCRSMVILTASSIITMDPARPRKAVAVDPDSGAILAVGFAGRMPGGGPRRHGRGPRRRRAHAGIHPGP